MNTQKFPFLVYFIFCHILVAYSQSSAPFQIGLLKYNGGGDWYANKETSLSNLIEFCNQQTHSFINLEQKIVDVGGVELFSVPFVHMTGHGNVVFSTQEAQNLRKYLLAGGFLHIDDNYGMDTYVRREMKKVFPELDFTEIPSSHGIYTQFYTFSSLPKIHEHDGKPAQAFGLFYEGKLVCIYTYEADLGDGWEDQQVHKDSQEIRLKALKMGVNILHYAFHRGK